MNKNEYYVIDIYDPKQVESTLSFAPYIGWELFSIQDVYSRSDVNISIGSDGKTAKVGHGEFNGDFARIVNAETYRSERADDNTETHITSYTKVVLKRDPSWTGRGRLAIQESVWKKMGALLKEIAKTAEEADRAAAAMNAKRDQNGVFVFGTIIMLLGAIGLAFGFGARSMFTWATLVQYISWGVLSLGLICFIYGLGKIFATGHAKKSCQRVIQRCINDYRLVSRTKSEFEKQIMGGMIPRVDSNWFYNICEDYKIPYVAPNAPEKK